MYETCKLMASWSELHQHQLKPIIERYQEQRDSEPYKLRKALFTGPRGGGAGLLRDLHDLWLAASEARLCYEVVLQAEKRCMIRNWKPR